MTAGTHLKVLAGMVTYPEGRNAIMTLSSALGMLCFLGLTVYSVVVNKQPFTALDYGSGFGAMVIGLGGALGIHTRLSAGPSGVSEGEQQ